MATVTANPAIDRTLRVERLEPGALHRVGDVDIEASGKGINVATALHGWGIPSVALGFVGGEPGRFVASELEARGIGTDLVWLDADTRINTKVIETASGRLTELNEKGPPIGEADVQALEVALDRQRGVHAYVFSGSLPPGAPASLYRELIGRVRGVGVLTVLDASGAPLAEGIAARPHWVKPNLVEMQQLLGRNLDTKEELCAAVSEVLARGVERVVLSLGAKGCIFADQKEVFWVKSRPVRVESPVGCGDTLVAALVYGALQGWAWKESAHFAVSAATARATTKTRAFPSLAATRAAGAGIDVEVIT